MSDSPIDKYFVNVASISQTNNRKVSSRSRQQTVIQEKDSKLSLFQF
jgi:hypothetical protein